MKLDPLVFHTLHTALDTLQTVTRAQSNAKHKREIIHRIKEAREAIDTIGTY